MEAPESPLGRRLTAAGELTLDDLRAELDDGDEATRRVAVAAGRFLGQAVAGVIGVLDVERIVLHGSVADLGPVWVDAVRDEAHRRALRLLAGRVSIEPAGAVAELGDLVVLGASAVLLTAELGLAVGR